MAAPGSTERSGNEDGGDEYVTAVASSSSAASDEASQYVTSMETLAAIEKSREDGWSEVKEDVVGASSRVLSVEDQLLWKKLKKEAPHLFMDQVKGFKLGKLMAEGGQACIHEAWVDGGNIPLVAKVFKMEGFSLGDLHRQWPRRKISSSGSEGEKLLASFASGLIFDLCRGSISPAATTVEFIHDSLLGLGSPLTPTKGRLIFDPLRGTKSISATTMGELIIDNKKNIIDSVTLCNVVRGFFLADGRFAFLMKRYEGDLRSFINLRLGYRNDQGPLFSYGDMLHIMYSIAAGMRRLHENGVLHRDLKAANVLCNYTQTLPHELIDCTVADYESAMMVQGTGFWRAPEVLENLLKQPCDRNEEVWTKKADVYSFAMTCYEVMTGHIPFYGYAKSDWKRVIDGERPHLPEYVDSTLAELVEMCWHSEPSKRPTFDDIFQSLGKQVNVYGDGSVDFPHNGLFSYYCYHKITYDLRKNDTGIHSPKT